MSDRHVTVNALNVVFPWADGAVEATRRRACDWEFSDALREDVLYDSEVRRLLRGESVDLPTCPACAALLDLALEMRATGLTEAAESSTPGLGQPPRRQ